MPNEPEIIVEDAQPSTRRFRPPTGGGRPLGSVNKKKVDVRAKCEELNCDPFTILALVANGDYDALQVDRHALTLKTRVDAAKELASYIAPKLKAIEVSTDDLGKTKDVYVVTLPASGRETPEQIEEQESELVSLTPNDLAQHIYNELDSDDQDQ